MDFDCYTDFDRQMHQLDAGRRMVGDLRGMLTQIDGSGSICVTGWPERWDEENLMGTWTISVYVNQSTDEEVRILRRTILSRLGWNAANWKRSFNESTGLFTWETSVPHFDSEGNAKHTLVIRIFFGTPESCTVEKVEEMVKVTKYVSKCGSKDEEAD